MSQQLVYLASASPRRAELLAQIGVAHRVRPAHVDESTREGEAAGDYVARLAADKAAAVWRELGEGAIVLGADTAVIVDEHILGKPVDRDDAMRMLRQLSDRTHEVMTAVSVIDAKGTRRGHLANTRVTMRAIDEDEMHAYWASNEPRDKAGAYAIQGLGGMFVTSISGSYSAVVGLPLAQTAAMLGASGIALWPDAARS